VMPPRKLEDLSLLVAIKAAHQRGRGTCGTYGPHKIQRKLADQDLFAGINRIKRLRKLHGIRCTHKKKFRLPTDSRHSLPLSPNLLDASSVRQRHPIKLGWPTSPIFRLTRDGSPADFANQCYNSRHQSVA